MMMELYFSTTERTEVCEIDLSDKAQLANLEKVQDFLEKSDVPPSIKKDSLLAFYFETKREYLFARNYCEEYGFIFK